MFPLLILFSLLIGFSPAGDYYNSAGTQVYYKNMPLKFSAAPVLKNQILYVPLQEIAEDMQLEVKYNHHQNYYEVTRAGDFKTVIFNLNRRKIMVNNQPDELEYPVILIKNQAFVPLNDFLWPLGYFVKAENSAYYILSRIDSIDWENHTLQIKGNAPVDCEIKSVPGGYVITVFNSILGSHEKQININDGVINNIEIRQESLNPARIKIGIQASSEARYTALQEDSENAFILKFNYHPLLAIAAKPEVVEELGGSQLVKITALEYRWSADGLPLLIVHSSAKIKQPRTFVLSKPLRYVIDLPDSVYRVPQKGWSPQDKYVKNIRGGQFAKGVSRIVLELAGTDLPKPSFSYLTDTSNLVVSFGAAKTLVAAAEPPRKEQNPVVLEMPAQTERQELSSYISRNIAAQVNKVAPVSPGALKGLIVAIIPGHGGNDAGALTRSGLMEKDINLAVSLKLADLLQKAGATVALARKDDTNVSLVEQAEFANNNRADLLVSIHFNSFPNPAVGGAESYYYKPIDQNFAREVHQAIIKGTGSENKGLKKAQMHNLNHTAMPGVLVEPAFLSNRQEENMVKTEEYQLKLARAIVQGIINYERKMRGRAR